MTAQGRRQEERKYYKAKASVCRAGTAHVYPAAVVDLASVGCLLRTGSRGDFEVDDLVDLTLQSSDLSLRARGTIRHIEDDGTALGIRFDHLTTRGKNLLTELIRELEQNPQVTV
jgi:hypothetical protein